VFDLDLCVIDNRAAWCYALDEAVMMATGERVESGRLYDNFRDRSWDHAVSVLVADVSARARVSDLAEQYYRRSALKRLLVFEGIGMALDSLRGASVEMGGITRETHYHAMRQIESTGVDRFLAVLSPTPEGEDWAPGLRIAECARYTETPGEGVLFVSAVVADLHDAGVAGLAAGWANQEIEGGVPHPGELARALIAAAKG
jgi:phosphoglycolate phosphatase-like HAD superfamily hydrolase